MEVKVLNSILEMYVLPESDYPCLCPLVFENPIEQKGYTIATNGKALIRIKTDAPGTFKEELKPDLSDIFRFRFNCSDVIERSDIERIISNPPLEDEEIENDKSTKCEECDGDGSVDAEYDGKYETYTISCDCPVCDGSGSVVADIMVKTGKQVVSESYGVEINGVFFYYRLAEKLLKTMQLLEVTSCIQVKKSPIDKNVYSMGDVMVLLMPKIKCEEDEY